MAEFNPIKRIRPQGGNWQTVPIPSSYNYILEDVSEPDAGRTEDAKMHKKTIGRVRALELEWAYPSTDKVSQILQAFDTEYYDVEFWDALTGTWATSIFYTGNRSVPMYSGILDIWTNIKFKIVERSVF